MEPYSAPDFSPQETLRSDRTGSSRLDLALHIEDTVSLKLRRSLTGLAKLLMIRGSQRIMKCADVESITYGYFRGSLAKDLSAASRSLEGARNSLLPRRFAQHGASMQ
jgi:hypothetical protein